MRQPDYYDLLGLAPEATHDAIHARFRAIIRQISSNPASASQFPPLAKLNEALRILGDPVERVYYDRSRHPESSTPVTPAEEPVVEPQVESHCPFCEDRVPDDLIVGPDTACPSCQAPLCPANRQSLLDDSRRVIDRLPFNMRVAFTRARAPQLAHKGISDDVSLGGMRVLTSGTVAVGDHVLLTCDFCTAVAIVRYVQPGADAATSVCGLQFITLRLKRQRGGLLSTTA